MSVTRIRVFTNADGADQLVYEQWDDVTQTWKQVPLTTTWMQASADDLQLRDTTLFDDDPHANAHRWPTWIIGQCNEPHTAGSPHIVFHELVRTIDGDCRAQEAGDLRRWVSSGTHHDASRFPHTCPKCGGHSYNGLTVEHEDPTAGCR